MSRIPALFVFGFVLVVAQSIIAVNINEAAKERSAKPADAGFVAQENSDVDTDQNGRYQLLPESELSDRANGTSKTQKPKVTPSKPTFKPSKPTVKPSKPTRPSKDNDTTTSQPNVAINGAYYGH